MGGKTLLEPAHVDPERQRRYVLGMHAVEFITELGKEALVAIPREIAEQLPKTGQAWVIILTRDDPEDMQWQQAAYEQFMRDDSPEDAVYDSYL